MARLRVCLAVPAVAVEAEMDQITVAAVVPAEALLSFPLEASPALGQSRQEAVTEGLPAVETREAAAAAAEDLW